MRKRSLDVEEGKDGRTGKLVLHDKTAGVLVSAFTITTGALKLYDMGGSETKIDQQVVGDIYCVLVNEDLSRMACIRRYPERSGDFVADIWDLQHNRMVQTISGFGFPCHSCKSLSTIFASPVELSGKRIGTVLQTWSSRGSLQVYDTDSGNMLSSIHLESANQGRFVFCFSPDQRNVIIAGYSHDPVLIFASDSGEEVVSHFAHRKYGRFEHDQALSVIVNSSGTVVMSGYASTIVWNFFIDVGEIALPLQNRSIESVGFGPTIDGHETLLQSSPLAVTCYDIHLAAILYSVSLSDIMSVVFNPRNNTVVVASGGVPGGNSKGLYLFEAESGKPLGQPKHKKIATKKFQVHCCATTE
jgi:WD40 repeat protein